MKKYLMTGIAAVALCAAFTSCSHEEGFSTLEEAKTAQYEAAFIEAFGKPAANQDWGFGSARTRAHANGAIDVNGNEWLPEDVPAVDDPREVNAIYDYVKYTLPEMDQMGHLYSTTAPQNLNGYYVTQVRHGKNADNVYDAFDGTHLENCGEKMNFLQIKFDKNAGFPVNQGQNDGWEHINNFNASFSGDHGAMTSKDFGNTKVVDQGAFDFAYYNSVDNKFHNNWILVDGYYITEDHKYENFYYVCFDFEGTPNCVSKFRFKYNGSEIGDFRVDGAWTAEEAVKQNLEVTLSDGTKIKLGEDIDKTFKSDVAGVYNGLQVESVENGDKKFDPDDKHTDWIIRITKGNPEEEEDPVVESGRIFCEDLGSIGDFDFNDVVFDAYIYQSGKIEIDIFAAGGRLPISVAGVAVDLGQMMNTGVNSTSRVQHISIPAETAAAKGWTTLKLIPIMVSQTNPAGVVESYELSANIGQVPQKIRVPLNTKWADEYIRLEKAYPDFKNYVSNPETNWTTNVVSIFVDYNLKNNGEQE